MWRYFQVSMRQLKMHTFSQNVGFRNHDTIQQSQSPLANLSLKVFFFKCSTHCTPTPSPRLFPQRCPAFLRGRCCVVSVQFQRQDNTNPVDTITKGAQPSEPQAASATAATATPSVDSLHWTGWRWPLSLHPSPWTAEEKPTHLRGYPRGLPQALGALTLEHLPPCEAPSELVFLPSSLGS